MGTQVGAKIYCAQPGMYFFKCPGCDSRHAFWTKDWPHGGPKWEWNNDGDKPTITPSLNVNPMQPFRQCHSNVTKGQIQFTDECWHPMKGLTVDLPDWDIL